MNAPQEGHQPQHPSADEAEALALGASTGAEAPAQEGIRAQPPSEPEPGLGKRVFRGLLFVALVATGLLIAHSRHPVMKGVFLGPSAEEPSATGAAKPSAKP